MANPRKFSEKIALQKQKQAEGTAEFEKIMKEVYATKKDETQGNQRIQECLPNSDVINNSVSTGGGSGGSGGGGGASPEGKAGGGSGGSPTACRESRGRSVGVGPMRRPSERIDRSPYGSNTNTSNIGNAVGMGGMSNNVNIAYLSPPNDTNWRRSNSDSALHQSLNIAVAAEVGFGSSGVTGIGGLPTDLGTLHASYNHNQRSHSPNIGRSLSPQAQRRKAHMMHQQQQQLHHQQQQQMHMQHAAHAHHQQQHQPQLQQHMQQTQQLHQQQHHTQQQHHQQQHHQQQQFNAKYSNCNMPANSLFKSLQEQMAFANTGSLPDLTSVHYPTTAQQPLIQQQQQHTNQQQILSPILSPHNNGRERDQSPSPFNSTNVGPPSPYNQQQHSPTSAANTPTAAQTSPHLSFTNLSVQSPTGVQNSAQTGSFTHLPTLGAASSTGNLTDYRQPLNPPSPGSSPGLLTSVSGNELHTSAPASPIRHVHTNVQQSMQGYSDKNIQTFDRYSPVIISSNADTNSGNLSFHNNFEQFSLGDSSSSPEQQQHLQQHFQHQQNNYITLEFEDFISSGNSQQQSYPQNKILDFDDLTGAGLISRNTVTDSNNSNTNGNRSTTATCNNNNIQQQQNGRNIRQQQQQQQQLLNNNSTTSTNTIGPCRPLNNNTNLTQHNDGSSVLGQDIHTSPIPSPLNCLPSASSPLPIPMPSQSPHHNHQHQLSLSLQTHSAQHSPHHSPAHSPHHSSPISAFSPVISTLPGVSVPASANTVGVNMPTHHNQQQHHQQQQQNQQQQHQQQSHGNTPTTANIPSIIFSDYSSNPDDPRCMLDSLDLVLDATELQLLADQNEDLDHSMEDNFRRDLN
ncbi:protein kinase 4 [Teleopsis dalmanni]|uniref:protein kinase 4 n=1 Tax=Teleopsis dalmanni TaxID=139649 RepID=UPI0018CE5034|nr:protein kinase 4 [Teleopsis dalmanni]